MNDNAKKWVAALESGEYKQAIGMLRSAADPDSFCCLGVACHVVDPERWTEGAAGGFRFMTDPASGDGAEIGMTDDVAEFMGVKSHFGHFDFHSLPGELQTRIFRATGEEANALTKINDRGGDFALIAEVLKAEPDGMFE